MTLQDTVIDALWLKTYTGRIPVNHADIINGDIKTQIG